MHHKSQRSRQLPDHRVIVIMQLCIVILLHAHRCAMVTSAIAVSHRGHRAGDAVEAAARPFYTVKGFQCITQWCIYNDYTVEKSALPISAIASGHRAGEAVEIVA